MENWKCSKCNHVFVGEEKPSVCPKCGKKAEFEMVDEMLPFNKFYDE
jgi:rubrerythrin